MYITLINIMVMKVYKGQNILNSIKELPNDDACKSYLV